MADFTDIRPEDFKVSPFHLIGDEWMLIAAEKNGRCNAMTASWGGLGHMWHMNVAFVVIRPQRFTKEFVDGSATFSLNFFGSGRRDMLGYMGSASGRDGDKIAHSALTTLHDGGTPYFGEAATVLLCRKLYAQPYGGEFFIDHEPDREHYPDKDYHTFYITEITRIMAKPGSF